MKVLRTKIAACLALCSALCSVPGAAGCSPFYAGLHAGSSPNDQADQDAIWNALMISLSVRPARYVFLTNSIFDGRSDGDFGSPNGTGIDEADLHCNADSARPFESLSYAALLSDGVNRVATQSPNCRAGCTGQIDWPLRTYTDYLLADGSLMFMTEANPIFIFGELSNTLSSEAGTIQWTGLRSDWTTGQNCQQWTSNGAITGSGGQSTLLNAAWLNAGEINCGSGARMVCVQL